MKIKTLSAVLAWLLISAGLGVGVVSLITVDKVGRASDAWEAFDKGAATKAVILSDLRGALGYGGMIHHFKNFVLRKDRIEIVYIQDELRQIAIALVRYESLGVTETEKLALERIDNVVMRYSNFVAVVEDLAANGAASSEIDAVVKVDDRAALEAIRDLQSELLAVRKVSGDQVYESVSAVSNLVTVSAIGLTFLLLVVIVGFNYFSRKRLTGPLVKLGQAMEALADGDFAIVVPFTGRGDEIGAMAGTVEVFRNNAIERQNEKVELQESEQRVRTFFDTITDGIITIDPGGIIRSANPAALRQFGYDIKEILGQSVSILMPEEIAREEIAREHDRHFSGYLQPNISNAIGLPREVTGRRKDGSTFPLELAVSEIVIDGAPIFTSHIRDITERKNAEAERDELERELSQAHRLESLGTLAGGIAHEINTPVQYIGDNTRFLKIAFSDLSLVLQKHMTLLEAASDSG
ncbi:MAG: PAS domain S-box protein, partial [Acidiferrobacterales bacterium]